MPMKTAMASVDLSGKLCYLSLFVNFYPWWAVYQSWALILSSPAAEGITAIVVPTPLRKIPGAWAERARVKPLACLNLEIFSPNFCRFLKAKWCRNLYTSRCAGYSTGATLIESSSAFSAGSDNCRTFLQMYPFEFVYLTAFNLFFSCCCHFFPVIGEDKNVSEFFMSTVIYIFMLSTQVPLSDWKLSRNKDEKFLNAEQR
jgi:hypothetical protein